MANITNQGKFHASVELDANEVFNTVFRIADFDDRKGFVTSFTGSGDLEVSMDGVNFRQVSSDANASIELFLTSEAFIRLTSAGSVNFVFI